MTKYTASKCKLNELNVNDLSEKTGIAKTQIAEYMNNKRVMSLNNAVTIAKALNVTVEDLYVWEQS